MNAVALQSSSSCFVLKICEMKLLLIICSLVTIAVAQEPSLWCNYYDYRVHYACDLTINNPNGFNNFTEIGGIHLEGFTNDDVTLIFAFGGGITTNLPEIICDTFPSIVDLEFFGIGLTEIDDQSLSGCSRMRYLYLFYNNINSISENAFANLHEISSINLEGNLFTTLPENVFASQQNLTELRLTYNSLNDLPNGIFRPLVNLEYLFMGYSNIIAISQWFTENRRLDSLFLEGNRITLSPGSFPHLEGLRFLGLSNNGISQILPGVFANLPNLQELELYGNNFTVLGADSFDLNRLITLDISSNPINTIDENAFRGLEGLSELDMSDCGIRDPSMIPFNNLNNLTGLDLGFNLIEDIPPGTFAPLPHLNYIGLWDNRLKTLRRNSFGTLTALTTLDLSGNIVNSLDRAIIDDAVNLNLLYFSGNLCANRFFANFMINRAAYLPMLETCFRNVRYIVDTVTESDGMYSFFNAPDPGIVLRVQSDNEVQISLTPFAFIWTPSIEIFIGATNNTQSVIRINEETDVVTIPTPNAIQPNQWNDFRIIWANQNILVFRANETYPFMSYTMQYFFNVNFYGLRAVETRATWSVQPVN